MSVWIIVGDVLTECGKVAGLRQVSGGWTLNRPEKDDRRESQLLHDTEVGLPALRTVLRHRVVVHVYEVAQNDGEDQSAGDRQAVQTFSPCERLGKAFIEVEAHTSVFMEGQYWKRVIRFPLLFPTNDAEDKKESGEDECREESEP